MRISISGTSICQCQNTIISDIGALDQTDSSQLRKACKFHDRFVGEVDTTSKINVSNTIAGCNESYDRIICDMPAMSKMKVVKVLSEFADGICS